jgi:DNA helicase II / ATP-dependent DNA helicase PcrA
MGWFSFLISQCVKPYQRARTGKPFAVAGLNFKGRRNRYVKKSKLGYYLDSKSRLYRDAVADFVVVLNEKTQGAVLARLERVYTHIFVDEVQDLVGYDLDVLDSLLRSSIALTLVGDPRQHTYSTNLSSRNKKYQGIGFVDWIHERLDICTLEERCISYRSNQKICDFADALYPELPSTTSVDVLASSHDGVFLVSAGVARQYYEDHEPVTVLRYDKNTATASLPAMNIGLSKGRTFDRVMLFPTKTMLQYLDDSDEKKLKSRAKLYVAATRARFSFAVVVPDS